MGVKYEMMEEEELEEWFEGYSREIPRRGEKRRKKIKIDLTKISFPGGE